MSYSFSDVPTEVRVGEPFTFTLKLPRAYASELKHGACDGNVAAVGSAPDESMLLDWIGLYPAAVPTLPGLSHGRWVYVPSPPLHALSPSTEVTVSFPASRVPPHSGRFELRVHHDNAYGTPAAVHTIHVVEEPLNPLRRIVFMVLLLLLCAASQAMLNAKGTCSYIPPEDGPDAIDDWGVRLTVPINDLLAREEWMAELLQALSSLCIDVALITLIALSTLRRSSVQPWVSLGLFLFFRFIAQTAATIPCPPGFLWPRGAVMGVPIPSLFIDYHPANDMFFSGHTGTTLVVAVELYRLGYLRTALFILALVLPFVSVLVVSFRVHRGIDVIAAIFAAIAATSLAERLSVPLDREILVLRRTACKRD